MTRMCHRLVLFDILFSPPLPLRFWPRYDSPVLPNSFPCLNVHARSPYGPTLTCLCHRWVFFDISFSPSLSPSFLAALRLPRAPRLVPLPQCPRRIAVRPNVDTLVSSLGLFRHIVFPPRPPPSFSTLNAPPTPPLESSFLHLKVNGSRRPGDDYTAGQRRRRRPLPTSHFPLPSLLSPQRPGNDGNDWMATRRMVHEGEGVSESARPPPIW